MTKRKHSRWFAWFWSKAVARESAAEREARRQVTDGLSGRVLEIGVGLGTNWQHLPAGVEYVGIEPDHFMLRRARANAAAASREVDLREAAAEKLPFEDGAFDAVFTTLTFCSVDDVPQALSEVRRVLKPGGEFRFWEHVRPAGRLSGRAFDVVTPLWSRLGAGCHPNRRTVEAIDATGMGVTSLRRFKKGPIPMVVGTAETGTTRSGP
ncbi:MAG: class I SAM-dependent methyltransferase [Tepidiformaceae bacterium]